MDKFQALTVVGLVFGAIYSITAAGLVVTYTTTGIFNFAHGAIGMIAAFAYWQIVQDWGWPEPVGLVLVVLVLAPLVGAIIERLLMRPLRGASLDAILTTTLGLLLFLIGLATVVWDPKKPRFVFQFFRGHSWNILGVRVSAHELAVVGAALAVALVLWLFLSRTRTGVALRSVVDNPDLSALAGASPERFGQLGWAIGAMLAALAGVLLASRAPLDVTTLTLLVINGYAAAMLGRLRNLPLTFAGGLLLGLIEQYLIGYLSPGVWLNTVRPTIPMAFLLLCLLVLPERRIIGRTVAIRSPRVAGLKESIVAGAVLVLVAWVVSGQLSNADLRTASHGVALSLIMLSLVLLVGYGGQVSLCQLTFAGLGAFAMGKVADGSSWWGLLAAVGLSAAVGVLVALPALRLRGLYLALATLAFAQAMDRAFFLNTDVMGDSLSLEVGRVSLPGIDIDGRRNYFVFLCAVFALIAIGLLALRRSAYGRRLTALAASPAASATIGMNLTATRITVFGISAGLAGLAGALYGGEGGLVSPNDFPLLLSLTLVLLAVIWGIRTMTGMLFAGLVFAIFPEIQEHVSSLRNLIYLGTGLGAIGIGRNPNGVFGGNTPLQRRRDKQRAREAAEAIPEAEATIDDAAIEAARAPG
jgi:branched-chain amino acid transport system permease protein